MLNQNCKTQSKVWRSSNTALEGGKKNSKASNKSCALMTVAFRTGWGWGGGSKFVWHPNPPCYAERAPRQGSGLTSRLSDSLGRQSVLIISKTPWLQRCWSRKIRWINNQSQGVQMQPEEEDSWQAEAPASAKDGTVPVTCGQAKGCQVWDKYFLKILSLLVKRYLILLWFVGFFLFVYSVLEHLSDKIIFQGKKKPRLE